MSLADLSGCLQSMPSLVLSSVHASGCLEATWGHAKPDLIYPASQQGLSSWPRGHTNHDCVTPGRELPCLEPAGQASQVSSHRPATCHIKMLSVAFAKLQLQVALLGVASF